MKAMPCPYRTDSGPNPRSSVAQTGWFAVRTATEHRLDTPVESSTSVGTVIKP